jgi:hypothetical protein
MERGVEWFAGSPTVKEEPFRRISRKIKEAWIYLFNMIRKRIII